MLDSFYLILNWFYCLRIFYFKIGLGEDYKSSHILNDVLTTCYDPLLVLIIASSNPVAITITSITLEPRLLHA